jgi:hypothetical protein
MGMEVVSKIYNYKKIVLISWLLVSAFSAYSQERDSIPGDVMVKIDSLYREDQFYFSFTYNTLQQKPAGLAQNKFSTGFSGGFLRDMPINKNRTKAFATGLGFSYNNYIQNLAITGTATDAQYEVAASNAYKSNKFSQFLIEVPVEFRIRNSTYESHKFYRFYGGLKFSYLLYDKSAFTDSQGKVVITSNKDFNKFLYGAYAAVGYNTINVYVYYGLNSIFKSAKLGTESVDMKSLNIGLIFYIL